MRKPWRRRGPAPLAHPPGLVRRLIEWFRGREQLLVRGPAGLPLLLVIYPRGRQDVARLLEIAYTHTLPSLPKPIFEPYGRTLAMLPPIVVVLLLPENPCGCLGHWHPPGAESRVARRLAADLSSPVAEIDLAYEMIRRWEPQPLASLAAGEQAGAVAEIHFEAALLAVLIHELHHMARPQAQEREIRAASNEFYGAIMRELVLDATGRHYGMIAEPRRLER